MSLTRCYINKMADDSNDWTSLAYRQKARQHIEDAIRMSGNPTNKTSAEMEDHVFQRAKSREEYVGFLSRLILHINKYKQVGDPMNALQNMAGQQQQQQPPQDQAAMLSMQGMAARGQMAQQPQGCPMSALQQQQQQQQQQRMQSQMMMQGGGQMNMLPMGGMVRQQAPGMGMMGPRGMAPSPGALSPMAPGSVKVPSQMSAPSPQLHTPAGPANATPSPRNQHDEAQYMEKVKQLSKYIEPIKRMIENTSQQDTAKLSKMKKLLDILENPSRQFPVDLLIKCEQVLEKLEINQHSDAAHGHSQQQHTTHKEYQVW
ncbi:mediator of RNA polymerase II transcription subunit 15-like [Pollicipes pollicipes]|uniref:mediator of RNA polymerase II transcription subunit 15-like n=1 Tax=Pollicipes pollicipes TaxID=41117 RepID=UPI0018849975|nr:mediator of RNA polymerase II transcription subunit 15-like [Pollicipes pollicipes]